MDFLPLFFVNETEFFSFCRESNRIFLFFEPSKLRGRRKFKMELWHHGIKGQRWGVRRYQNADGSLTAAGQKRYDRDIRENNAKKKENRAIIDGPDPKRWVAEDLTRPKPTPKRFDLSEMSDQDLRNRINRELLEQQYNKLFADTSSVQVSKGRAILQDTLDVAGSVLAITGSALSIALAIKKLND